ncbi:Anillin-like protein 1 [Caenorhabditis elegans]|uniref:Anillin-like protein 1 n=1 Tax=Caenorhabditis elegans TaxID=6239 RepID=ANI1_CAEEL|nr:Anillin-like protein 1 [Caenorhabditis elegans]Q9XTT4.2 RecName: Full=Anillin-like protein 1 [Caenorhabditis elegans]CAB11565.2 Anillin-like protein 1 [Caenorhabditis elegans]|eukprot:NP_499624.2 Anillin-like protein 1 [Caenorhabditis elegans]
MGDQFDSLMERIRVRQAEMSGEGEVAKENGPVTSKITSVKQEVASPTKVFGSSSKCNDGPSTPVHFHPQEPKETTPNMKENAENSLNSFKDATVNESSSKKTSRFSMLAQEIDEYEYDYQSQYNKPKEAYMKGRSPRMSIGETRPAVLCTPAGAQAMKSPNVAVSSKSAPEIALGMSDFEARRIKFAQPIVNVNYLPNESSIFSGGSGSSVNDQSTVLGGSAEMMNVTTSSLSCGELSMNQHITHENTIINAQSCDNREAILRERQQVSNEEYGPHTFMRKKVPKEASSATSSSSSTTTLTTISGASGSTTSGISNAPQDSASTKTTTNTFTSSYLLTKTSNNNINALVSSSPKPFSKDIGRSMFSPVHFTPKSTSSPKTLSESIFSPSKSAAVEGSIATTRRLQFEEKLKKSSSANVTAPPAPTSAPVPTPRHVAPLAPTVAQQSHLTPNHRHAAQQKKHLFPVVGIVATAPIPVQTQWRGQSNTPVVQGARADEKTAGNEPPVGAGVGKLKNLKSRWEFSSATGTPIHPDATEDSLIATAIKMKESAIPKQLGHRSERKGPSASSLYSQGARSNTASPASKSTRYEQEEEDDVFEAPEFNDGGDVISEDGILQEEEEDTSKFIDNAFGFMEGSGAGTPSPYREPPLQRLEKNRPPAEVIEEETENEDESEPYEPEEEEDDDATTQFPVPERSRKSSSQLAYSVSFYRKIQRDRNEESSTVLAGPVISQISPSAPPMSSSLTSQQKLRQLTTGPANGARIVESAKDAHDRIKRAIQVEEQLVAQSKRAMILARDKPSFRGSREEFEAQWAMLRHVEKHRALLTEYDRLKRDGPRIIDGPRGTITVSQLSVNMARDYVSANIASSKKSDEVFYFAAILRYGEQVDVSKMVTSDGGLNRRGVLEFPVPLMLTGIPPDFRATVEIYGQRSMRESTSHEDKYKLKNSTFKAKTRNTFLGGGSTSSANQSLFVDPAASSSSTSSTTSNFNLLGTFSFDINCPGKHLYNMSHTVYPLEGITQMKVRKQAIDGADITYHGFLSMYQRTGEGLGSWTRYWCALENGEMKFWKQPEDEGTKGYTALMDLSTCCRSEGASVVEDICPFPNSFHIDVWAPKMDTSDPRGIERLRVMLAADTAQDLQTWLSLINSTSKQLCTWRNPIVNQ